MKKLRVLLGKWVNVLSVFRDEYRLEKYRKLSGADFKFVPQGTGGLTIDHAESLKIDKTSHFKSATYVDARGGVEIGRYFHTGRGLTIFTGNHIYENDNYIPYDKVSDLKPVIIDDFVWCGANVTILPGVHIGEGAVIGAGSVVVKDIPAYAIAAGNPCTVKKYRNIEKFLELKEKNQYF